MEKFERSKNNTGALLNIDSEGLELYKNARNHNRRIMEDHKRLYKLEEDLTKLKKSINNIEVMLKNILEKNN